MEKELQSYLEFLRAEGKSACTVTAYGSDLRQFLGYVARFFPAEVVAAELSVQMIRDWLRELHYSRVGNRSLARKAAALKSFFLWLKLTGRIALNPMDKVKRPKFEKPSPISSPRKRCWLCCAFPIWKAFTAFATVPS